MKIEDQKIELNFQTKCLISNVNKLKSELKKPSILKVIEKLKG